MSFGLWTFVFPWGSGGMDFGFRTLNSAPSKLDFRCLMFVFGLGTFVSALGGWWQTLDVGSCTLASGSGEARQVQILVFIF